MKTVVIVGVFEEGSSNNGIAKAFEKLGFIVKRIPYRKLINTLGVDLASTAVINVAQAFTPDFMLFCKCNGLPSDILKECKEYSKKTCLWYMDSMYTLRESCPEIISHCHNVDFSIHWPGVGKSLSELEIKNCYGLIESCDEKEFYPVKPNKKYVADISFIGTRNTYRDSFIDALRKEGIKVRCYGNGFDEYVTGGRFNEVCSSSKMILNIGTYNHIWGYFSDRIVRTFATKTFSLNHYVPGFEDYFENRKHMAWFNTVEECVSLAKEYLVNGEERQRVTNEGYKLFLEKHTCVHFVKDILSISESIN